MNKYFQVIGVTGKDGQHYPKVERREGIRLIPVTMSRTINLFADLTALFKLWQVFRKEKPEIVHTHTPKAGLLGMLAARLAGVPIRIHTVAGMPLMGVSGIRRSILNLTERLTYSSAHKVWPNSRGLRKFIIEQRFCSKDKLEVIANGASNGVDTSFFAPEQMVSEKEKSLLRQQYHLKDEDQVFCFIGRIAREKGIVELVDAFQKLHNNRKEVKLILVGLFEKAYGGLSIDIEKRISDHPAIHFLGRADDVRPFLWMSDIFVFPSYREGFPNALMEAGALSLPSIATDINGCNEIISHNVNGLLIRSANSNDLFLAMKLLIEDKKLRERLASNARKHIVDNFSNLTIWTAMKSRYHELIDERIS